LTSVTKTAFYTIARLARANSRTDKAQYSVGVFCPGNGVFQPVVAPEHLTIDNKGWATENARTLCTIRLLDVGRLDIKAIGALDYARCILAYLGQGLRKIGLTACFKTIDKPAPISGLHIVFTPAFVHGQHCNPVSQIESCSG